MNIGTKILEARKRKKLTLVKLSKMVNIPISSLSGYERGKGPRITDIAMIKIAIALNDTSILIDHCRFCLVRSHILQEHYPGINFHRRDPKEITKRLHMDVAAAAEAAKRLQVRHSDLDIQMISELRRSIELWEYELVLATCDDQVGTGPDRAA